MLGWANLQVLFSDPYGPLVILSKGSLLSRLEGPTHSSPAHAYLKLPLGSGYIQKESAASRLVYPEAEGRTVTPASWCGCSGALFAVIWLN